MILEGNARGYGAELARHLLNPRDNDHVTVHAVEGFLADDLAGAFAEAEAISQATQCQKYLFSLSLNPPPNASVSVEAFEAAIAQVERKLGLVGQPRAIVFHEKNGRRHAHCVWSRIDNQSLTAAKLSHSKRKLMDVTRDLFVEHSWDMPEGLRDHTKRDPLNYCREEAAQAKRLKRDPAALKAMFQRCWAISDSRAAFAAALEEQGYVLAQGERRGFVAVDADGKVWSLSRWCGVKPRELRRKLGPEQSLPTVAEALSQLSDLSRPQKLASDPKLEFRRAELVARQREERAALLKAQEERRIRELRERHASIPTGLSALFFKLTGHYDTVIKQAEGEARSAKVRDRVEQQALIDRHLTERRTLTRELRRAGLAHDNPAFGKPDARQGLELPVDGLELSREQLLRDPARILPTISKMQAQFTRKDVLRALAKLIDDPFELKEAADRALRSNQLVRLPSDNEPVFTTRDYQATEERLHASANALAATTGPVVDERHRSTAIAAQNNAMGKAFGGKLSAEQCQALDHVLGSQRLACVVGLAGAGKSTMLATAMDAWTRQGITVHGAALAGKAADGLESASGIASRTLASLEASWENGYEPIATGDVLVIDEAGMVGTRQLARVTSKIDAIGAKLVLIGDPDQLQPIEAGSQFRDLVDRQGASTLSEIHRQREDWQREASRDLASGNITKAMTAYANKGAVRRDDDAFEALVECYAMDVAANGNAVTRLAFAHRRKDVHALNQAIRAAIRTDDPDNTDVLLQTATGKRAFGDKDRIVFTRNDRDIGVKNGMLGIVEKADESELVVRVDGDQPQTIRLDPRSFQSFDHGYAVSIHKSQGVTVDRAYVLASRTMDRHLAYVAMTRHRDHLQLFVRSDDQPTWAMRYRALKPERASPHQSRPSLGERSGYVGTISDSCPTLKRAIPVGRLHACLSKEKPKIPIERLDDQPNPQLSTEAYIHTDADVTVN
ncbi:MAG: AAA family ATPase [Pseudomonadota bacterium]